MRHWIAAVVVFCVLAGSCSGGGVDVSETPSTTSTTVPVTVPEASRLCAHTGTFASTGRRVEPLDGVSAIEVVAGEPAYEGVLGQVDIDRLVVAPVVAPPGPCGEGIAPLTGLPLDDPAVAERPAVIVKIDNTSSGRPQEALAEADLIYEEMIEGGSTRLGVVFHTNAPLMGPVRSGRSTDIALIGSLNEPVYAWSGGNAVHAALLRSQPLVDLGAQTRSEYFRAADRPSTYDLMVDAQALLDIAESEAAGGAPPPHFEYRVGSAPLPSTASPATSVTVTYPSVHAQWDWDEVAGGWARTQGSSPHVDAQGRQVVAANVLVAEVADVATGAVDSAGSTVYEQQFLGTGRGWVFTDGHAIEVTWTKPSIRSVATWTTADGEPVALTPGLTWIELTPDGATTFS